MGCCHFSWDREKRLVELGYTNTFAQTSTKALFTIKYNYNCFEFRYSILYYYYYYYQSNSCTMKMYLKVARTPKRILQIVVKAKVLNAKRIRIWTIQIVCQLVRIDFDFHLLLAHLWIRYHFRWFLKRCKRVQAGVNEQLAPHTHTHKWFCSYSTIAHWAPFKIIENAK